MKIERYASLKEDALLEMSNFNTRTTGLPYRIWIDGDGVKRTNTHSLPRLKVEVEGNLIPVIIDKDNPRIPSSVGNVTIPDFALIQEYIRDNYEALLNYWLGNIDTEALVDALKEYRVNGKNLKKLLKYISGLSIENELIVLSTKKDFEDIQTFGSFELYMYDDVLLELPQKLHIDVDLINISLVSNFILDSNAKKKILIEKIIDEYQEEIKSNQG